MPSYQAADVEETLPMLEISPKKVQQQQKRSLLVGVLLLLIVAVTSFAAGSNSVSSSSATMSLRGRNPYCSMHVQDFNVCRNKIYVCLLDFSFRGVGTFDGCFPDMNKLPPACEHRIEQHGAACRAGAL